MRMGKIKFSLNGLLFCFISPDCGFKGFYIGLNALGSYFPLYIIAFDCWKFFLEHSSYGAHSNGLVMTLPRSIHNICFQGE